MIRCHVCPETAPDVEAAARADWLPSFWLDATTEVGPLCPRCAGLLTRLGPDGEIELIPGLDAWALRPGP